MLSSESTALVNRSKENIMDKHIVVGAGPVGSAVAQQLVERGAEVVVVTRSGTAVPGTRPSRPMPRTPLASARSAYGATAIYNCVNPPYHLWQETWPPIAARDAGRGRDARARCSSRPATSTPTGRSTGR